MSHYFITIQLVFQYCGWHMRLLTSLCVIHFNTISKSGSRSFKRPPRTILLSPTQDTENCRQQTTIRLRGIGWNKRLRSNNLFLGRAAHVVSCSHSQINVIKNVCEKSPAAALNGTSKVHRAAVPRIFAISASSPIALIAPGGAGLRSWCLGLSNLPVRDRGTAATDLGGFCIKKAPAL